MQIKTSLFPSGIAEGIANPSSLGSITNNIFSYPSSIIRILGGYNIINLAHNATAPISPVKYQVWVKQATIANGALTESDVKIYDGINWVDPTQDLWKGALSNSGTVLSPSIVTMLSKFSDSPNGLLYDGSALEGGFRNDLVRYKGI